MVEIRENTPSSIPEMEQAAQVVLETFRSARPQDAFETAVRAYRRRNPTVPNTVARQAVAKIICGEAL